MAARKIGFTVVSIWETKADHMGYQNRSPGILYTNKPLENNISGKQPKLQKTVNEEDLDTVFLHFSLEVQVKDTNKSLEACVIPLSALQRNSITSKLLSS